MTVRNLVQGRFRLDVTWEGEGGGSVDPEKLGSLTVDNGVRRTISDDDDAEKRRPRGPRTGGTRHARYNDAGPMKLKTAS